jgi:phosphopantothenoylcysteine synthetase/decarboxylase
MSGPILVRSTVVSEVEAGFRRSLKTRLRLSTGLLALLFALTPASIDPVQISLVTPAAHAGDNGNNDGGNNNSGNSNGGHNDGGHGDQDDGDRDDHDDVVEEELSDLDEELDEELDDGAEAEALGSGWI